MSNDFLSDEPVSARAVPAFEIQSECNPFEERVKKLEEQVASLILTSGFLASGLQVLLAQATNPNSPGLWNRINELNNQAIGLAIRDLKPPHKESEGHD